MIHVYAFTRPGAPHPAVAGAQLEACTVDDVSAVYSTDDVNETGHAAVIAHGLVVEALREVARAVLPVRFGERFASRAELAAAMREQHATLRAGLARVEGCDEFGVRMIFEDDRGAPRGSADGSSYMRSRLASQARADALVAELHEPLERCARAVVVAPGAQHAAAFLVPHEAQPTFESAVSSFAAAHPTLTVLCTGPWAPYNFTAEAA